MTMAIIWRLTFAGERKKDALADTSLRSHKPHTHYHSVQFDRGQLFSDIYGMVRNDYFFYFGIIVLQKTRQTNLVVKRKPSHLHTRIISVFLRFGVSLGF